VAKSYIVETESERHVLIHQQHHADIVVATEKETEIVEVEVPSDLIIAEIPTVEVIELCSPCAGTLPDPNAPATGGGGGALFISDVTPNSGGIVSSKLWTSGTVPAEVDITESTTDKDEVRIHVYVEGDSKFYTPEVTVDGNTVTNLVQDTYDKRTYTGSYDVLVTETRAILVETNTGLTDEVIVNRAAVGPEIQDITFGSYPGTQTELKSGDTISVTITTEPEATSVTLYTFGAVQGKTISANAGSATSTFTISGNTGDLSVKGYAQNAFGTAGRDFTSSETLTLNQTYPSVGTPSVSYPTSQSAIKGTEQASLTSTVTNFDTIDYAVSVDLSLNESSSSYENVKTVNRIFGDYIVSGTNYTITANRAANNATTIRSALVRLVDVAPTASISIDGSPSRLRSKLPSGKNYTVRVIANQQLLSYNSLDADKGTPSSFSGNSKTLLIEDSTVRGTGTFSNLSITGLSGIIGTVITGGENYTVGGFELRTITFGVVSSHEPIGTTIGNINKTRLRLAGTTDWFTLEVSTADVVDGYTITDSGGVFNVTGDYVFLTSVALVGSNSSGTLQVEFEEQV
jgi:hypothetical protein